MLMVLRSISIEAGVFCLLLIRVEIVAVLIAIDLGIARKFSFVGNDKKICRKGKKKKKEI